MAERNLAEEILGALERSPGRLEYRFHGSPRSEELRGPDMVRRIVGFARGFRAADLQPRSVVPIVSGSSAALWSAFVGAIAADLIPCILAAPTFKTHVPTYVRNVIALMKRYHSSCLLVADAYRPRLAPILEDSSLGVSLRSLESLDQPASGPLPPPHSGGSDVAFLQHSSGSTGTPKGVALDHTAVLSHLAAYASAIDLDPERDRICSWLPLYHDMGLITSFLLPLRYSVPCETLPPEAWIIDPLRILSLVAERQGTLCWWPNFTYALLSQRVRPLELPRYRLASLRALVNCSEPVLPGSHDAFHAAFGAAGIAATALQTCYAMAENVFAVSQSDGAGPLRISVDRRSLVAGQRIETRGPGDPEARALMSSGRVLEGVGLRVVDQDRRPVPDGVVGEIAIAGASLFHGYYMFPEAGASVLKEGWYYTGDIGFVESGEVFVLGRESDLIIVGGRKFYPNDVEQIVNEVPGIRQGRAVAFGVLSEQKGTQEVVVLAESPLYGDRGQVAGMRREIKSRVLQRLDCAVDHVVILAPQSLIKTSSGKVARKDNCLHYLEHLRART